MNPKKRPYHRCICGRVQLRPYKRCLHRPKGGLVKSGLRIESTPDRIWRQLKEALDE